MSFPETEFSNTKGLKLLRFVLCSPHPSPNLLTVSCLWTQHESVFWKPGLSGISGSLQSQREIFKANDDITNRPETL